jgi:hypothetical protein
VSDLAAAGQGDPGIASHRSSQWILSEQLDATTSVPADDVGGRIRGEGSARPDLEALICEIGVGGGSCASGRHDRSIGIARINRSNPFWGSSRPTATMFPAVGAAVGGGGGDTTSTSTAFGMLTSRWLSSGRRSANCRAMSGEQVVITVDACASRTNTDSSTTRSNGGTRSRCSVSAVGTGAVALLERRADRLVDQRDAVVLVLVRSSTADQHRRHVPAPCQSWRDRGCERAGVPRELVHPPEQPWSYISVRSSRHGGRPIDQRFVRMASIGIVGT